MRTPLKILFSRSIGCRAFPAMVILIAINVLARDKVWAHEWLWGIYNYHFVIILLGPLVAGLAAWEGYQQSKSKDIIDSTGRSLSAAIGSWVSLLAWTYLAYLLGLLLVFAFIVIAGTPGWPGVAVSATLPPALALLAAETAIGYVVGFRTRTPLSAPAVAVGVFTLSILLYLRGGEKFIRVGGATASLVGIEPRASVQVLQTAFYAAIACIALLLCRQLLRTPDLLAFGPVLGNIVIIAALGLALARPPSSMFQPASTAMRCTSSRPVICLAPGYAQFQARVSSAVMPYWKAFAGVGITTPRRFSQAVLPGNPSAASLPLQVVLGDGNFADSALLSWYTPKGCDISASAATVQTFVGLQYWLDVKVMGPQPGAESDPQLPDVLKAGSSDQQIAWVRNAVVQLAHCA